jgi:hypothetical protein
MHRHTHSSSSRQQQIVSLDPLAAAAAAETISFYMRVVKIKVNNFILFIAQLQTMTRLRAVVKAYGCHGKKTRLC